MVLTRFGQQRTIITVAQVLIAPAQVDDLYALASRGLQRLLQIVLRRHQVFAGEIGCPVFQPLDNNDYLALCCKRDCGISTFRCC